MNDADFAAVEFRMLNAFIGKTAVQALAERFRAQGVSLGHLQFGVLQIVSDEPQGLTDLSRKLGLAPSTLVPTIDSLEERQLVVRQRDTADRRRVLIEVTRAGSDMLDTLLSVHEGDPLHSAITRLGEERTALLLDTLRELIGLLPEGQQMLEKIDARLEIYRQHKLSAAGGK